MNVVGLVEEGKTTPCLWRCGNCGTHYRTQEDAEKCCKSVYCTVCGKEIIQARTKCREYYYINPIRCSSCYQNQRDNSYPIWTEAEYLEKTQDHKAEGVFWGDEYYTDLYDCLQYMYDDGYTKEEAKQQLINPCEECPIDKIEIDRELERIVENTGLEDPDYDVIFTDLKELDEFIKQWNAKQDYVYYAPLNINIKVDEKTFDEYWEDEEEK